MVTHNLPTIAGCHKSTAGQPHVAPTETCIAAAVVASAAMTTVLYLGLEPRLVDFTSFPDLTEEKLAAQLREQVAQLCAAGLDTTFVGVDRGETAAAVTAAALAARPYDVVLIGAGLRTVPALLTLFEALINVVHQLAPRAHVCFNTSPRDSEAAIRRWVTPARG